MQNFWNEVRQSARALTVSRGFTAAVVATLAAAVALETTTLSVVNAYLVRSLPYPAAERLYRIAYAAPGQDEPRHLERADWASLSDVAEEQVAWDLDVFYMMGGEYPEAAGGQWVTPGFMRALGVHPVLGRAFRPEDFKPGAPQVALINDDLWHRRFGGDSSVVGRSFTAYVSDRPHHSSAFTIVGVLPATFWHWTPYTQVVTPLRAPTYPYFLRLRAGVTPTLAERRVSDLVRHADPTVAARWSAHLEPVQAAYTKSVRPLLLAIGAAVTLVLLIACANVALLMVLRGIRRQADMAVRVALGATSRQIARLLISESLLLCAGAAAMGLAAAVIVSRALGPMIEQQIGRRVPGGSGAFSVDATVAAVVALLALAMTLATALPTLIVMRRGGLGFGSRSVTDGPRVARARALLIGLQIAGSFGLLAGCGLMVRTLGHMLDVPLGVTVGRTVQATVATREQSYSSPAAYVALYDRLLSTLARTPGVASAALATPSPMVSYNPRAVTVEGGARSGIQAPVRSVTSNYFALLQIGIRQGRGFSAADRPGAEPVALVSASFARALWPASPAIGHRLRMYEHIASGGDSALVTRTIVGVVNDVRQSATDAQTADVYLPLMQAPSRFASIVVAPAGTAVDWALTLRRGVRAVDPEATVGEPQLLAKVVDDQLSRPRFLISVFAVFGIFAALIGVLGVYAVTGYTVKQREREIAVRVAVGADRRSVVRLFLRQAGRQLVFGLALGVVAAWGIGRLLASELFGTATMEPMALATIGALLSVACALAVALPAWRAGGADPTVSLRA